jgi:hypothetical protein
VGWLKIAVEQRGDRWLAQVVHVGENMHWYEHRRLQNKMLKWVDKNLQHQVDIQGWQFFFHSEQDLTLFLLRWNGQ